MQDHFMDIKNTQELLSMARTGLWVIEMDQDRAPRMYSDKAMLELLGLKEMPSPEECYELWYGRIDPAYCPMIQSGVEKMIRNERAEVQYPWEHPVLGRIYVRCGGVRDLSYQGGVCLRGYHQNITDTVMLKDKARLRDNVLSNLCQCYYSIYLFDLDHDTEEAIWQETWIEKSREFPKGSLKLYYEKFIQGHVCHEDQEKMRRAGSPEFLRMTLSRDHPVYDIDFRRQYPEGVQWVRSRFSVAEMEGSRVAKVIFANMNIHDQKMMEMKQEEEKRNALMAAYEAAQYANEAKSNFLAQMSHDIRIPMNAIVGMTSIALAQVNDPGRVKDCLKKISMSSSHLLNLIDEVLDMSKIEKGKMELSRTPFCLRRLLCEVETIICPEAEKKKQSLTVDGGQLMHDRLIGDSGRLRQVLLNLLSNAVKYTPEGGRVELTAKEVTERSPGSGTFVFIVEDNGIGMSEDFRDYVFVPFMRENDDSAAAVQGTGLGMSIAQGIVNAMNGSIQVETQKNRGSRFTVTLSMELDGEEHMAGDPGHGAVSGLLRKVSQKTVRLLVAEDNELNMEIVHTILSEAGFLVEEACNGQEALDLFESSAEGYYQAVLMDLQMPVMDGYTAARRIRNSSHPQSEEIPIIALTANAFAEDMAKALSAGMNDHVSKPIDYDRLFAALNQYIP